MPYNYPAPQGGAPQGGVAQEFPVAPPSGTPNLANLLASYMGQAQPQPYQPEGFQQAAGQSQMDLLKALQPPTQGQFGPIEQELMRRHQQETIPALQRQFGGRQASSAFQQATLGAERDLSSQLQAGQQRNLGQLQQFLSGQQQFGQQERQLGLQGAMGLGGLARGYEQDQLQALLDALGKQVGYGAGQGDTIRQEGMMKNLMQALSNIASAYAGAGRTT